MTVALIVLLSLSLAFLAVHCQRPTPFHLHPENPHYFLFRGEPTVLITSAEHYGAVLNADFDYERYLKALAGDGLNHTRLFVGAYCEQPGDFRIARNTLAPAPGSFVCPWGRSNRPGYASGGNKFDLATWDGAYFERLTDFVARAGERGIVVEITLFCPFYTEVMWDLNPMKAANNVNGAGAVDRENAFTADGSGDLFEVQVAMVRKVASELRDFDNIYYEIMNEPYQRDVPMEWQERMIDALVEVERELGVRHLISLNIANDRAQVEDAHPEVSLFNFHYAWPPATVAMNYHLDRAIGDNETGFHGTGDFHYRREGWAFILAGGALYNNLDYSFAVGYEDGSFAYPDEQPGGGTAALRAQLRVLGNFIRSFDFVKMAPLEGVAVSSEDLAAYALADPGRHYAVYLCQAGETGGTGATTMATATLTLDLPAGTYRGEWIETSSGECVGRDSFVHEGGTRGLPSPAFSEDLALRLVSD